jgi:hypothetical protein
MTKSIRLLNVDYIVTSSDKTIDLNNLEVTPLHSFAADGHSTTASIMIAAGGATPQNAYQLKSFDDGSYKYQGSLHTQHEAAQGASNGTDLMIIGYHYSNYYDKSSKMQIAEGSTTSDWGNAGVSGSNRACASNSDYCMASGGQNPTTLSQTDLKTFSSNAAAVRRNNISYARSNQSAASNGQIMLVAGGGVYDKITFDDTGTSAVSYGSLSHGSAGMGATSNGYIMLTCGYSSTASSCEKKSFDSNADTTVAPFSMVNAHGDISATSNGDEIMTIGNQSEKKLWSDDSNFSQWGVLAYSYSNGAEGSA